MCGLKSSYEYYWSWMNESALNIVHSFFRSLSSLLVCYISCVCDSFLYSGVEKGSILFRVSPNMWTYVFVLFLSVCLSVGPSFYFMQMWMLSAYSIAIFSILSTSFANLYSYYCSSRNVAVIQANLYFFFINIFIYFFLLTFVFVGYIRLFANCLAHKFIYASKQ